VHTLTTYKQNRVRIPGAEPGQVFACEKSRDGTITLTQVKKAERSEDQPAKFRLVKEGGYTVIETDRNLSLGVIKEALN
jgi:hypothetical protein